MRIKLGYPNRKAEHMKFLFVVVLLVGISLGNVDILVPCSGTVPIVGWTQGNESYLMYCEETAEPMNIGSSYSDMFLSLHEASGLDPVLMVISGMLTSWDESVVLRTINFSDLSEVVYRELSSDEFSPPPGYCSWLKSPILPRYTSSDEDRHAFIVMNTGYTDALVQDEVWMTTAPVDPWSAELIDPSETIAWNASPYIHDVTLSGQIPSGTLPMFSPGSGYSWVEMGYDYHGVCSFIEDGTLGCEDIYTINEDDPDVTPAVLCSGYGQSDQLALWNDAEGTVWSANFTTSPSEPVNSILPLSHIELPFASAMTKTREDEGIVLVWYDGSNIMLKYRDSDWNDYSHVIESVSSLAPGNLAVCSDTDGYWVAWKNPTKTVAEYRFISRDTVTGIEGSGTEVAQGIEIFLVNNPVQSFASYSISLPVDGHYSLQLYDLTGRNLEEVSSGFERSGEGILDMSAYPSGVYSLVLESGNGVSAVRMLKIAN